MHTASSDTPRARRVGWYSIVLHAALVVLAVQVVLLTRAEPTPPPIESIAAGDTVESLDLHTLDGAPQTIELTATGRDTLLFVFTTGCPVCRETAPTWTALTDRTAGALDIVGVSLDEPEATRAYADEHGFRFPIFVAEKAREFARQHRIPAVPHTVWVGPDGTVKEAWVGLLEAEQIATLTAAAAIASHGPLGPAPRDV